MKALLGESAPVLMLCVALLLASRPHSASNAGSSAHAVVAHVRRRSAAQTNGKKKAPDKPKIKKEKCNCKCKTKKCKCRCRCLACLQKCRCKSRCSSKCKARRKAAAIRAERRARGEKSESEEEQEEEPYWLMIEDKEETESADQFMFVRIARPVSNWGMEFIVDEAPENVTNPIFDTDLPNYS